jgi:hypothetical protein
MTDVIDRLADLGQIPIAQPETSTIDGDLARARKALRRRHRRAGSATLSLAVVVAGGTAWFTSDSHHSARRTPVVAAQPTPLKIKLVDYVGQEPRGFNIGTIPQGYDLDLQASTPYSIVVAPSEDANKDPDSFVGKLVVSAEEASTFGPLSSLGTQSVSVGNAPGRLGDDGTATQIWWQVGSIVIDVQSWDSIGLTHQQIVDFASSVSTTSQLKLSLG